jgi:TetR/AcrR family transcriptional regulator of autoinduction and epiphytic fitness
MAGRRAGPGTDTGEYEFLPPGFPDQRRARSARTRDQFILAEIELIDGGFPPPTPTQVAVRAGKSLRTFYLHFRDIDELFVQAARLQASRYRSSVGLLPPKGPVGLRIRATCRQRRDHFEVVGPVLRVAYARALDSADLAAILSRHRTMLRRQLSFTFGPEIMARGSEGQTALDVVDLFAGLPNWNALRFEGGHSEASAERTVVFAVTSALCN